MNQINNADADEEQGEAAEEEEDEQERDASDASSSGDDDHKGTPITRAASTKKPVNTTKRADSDSSRSEADSDLEEQGEATEVDQQDEDDEQEKAPAISVFRRGDHEITYFNKPPTSSTTTTSTDNTNKKSKNHDTRTPPTSMSQTHTHTPTGTSISISKTILELSRRGRELGGEGLWESLDPTTNTTATTLNAEEVKAIVTTHRREDQQRNKARRLDEWNQQLDSGKVKKLKKDKDLNNNELGNQFQTVQNQILNGHIDSKNQRRDDKVNKHKRNMTKHKHQQQQR